MPPAAKTPSTPPLLRPQATIMLSRVAHSLYWMSRYIERAENVARLLDVNLQFLSDFQDVSSVEQNTWGPLILSSGQEELFGKYYEAPDSRTVTEFLAFDLRNPDSILACVYAARENARMVRDQISLEMWETINELYLLLKEQNTTAVWEAGPQEFFAKINRASHLFQGLTASTYSRSEGWEFIEFGKYLERADKTTRILDVKYHILLPSATDVGGALDTAQWQAVLRSASALEAYRRYYVREILAWKAAEFLIFSDSFPRSLHFCVLQVDDFLRRILGESGTRPRSAAARASRRLLADLQSLTITDVLNQGLHEFLMDIQSTLASISDEVAATTMFYPAESVLEDQQQQQQQARETGGAGSTGPGTGSSEHGGGTAPRANGTPPV
ncbi:MAG: alpha-E domain-containing protein [Opitutaceae bacterium]|nr:alpha-E domain-containing protein [Opitutaceae bacterium]